MDWKKTRRGQYHSRGGENGYMIIPKGSGQFFVEGYRPGGARIQLPFRNFDTVEDAMTWVEAREQKEVNFKPDIIF